MTSFDIMNNKLVIRRLPPSMSEDDFLKQVSPLPNHDYFCFFEANSGLGSHSFSRAYINFLDSGDVTNFRDRFDNYVFLDKDGHEYTAVVEQSLWHKSPKDGPFYIETRDLSTVETSNLPQAASTTETSVPKEPTTWIEQDHDFLEFLNKLQSQKKRPQHSPIQTLETNLEELTSQAGSNQSGNKDNTKVITPLIGYVNQQRTIRSSKKAK